MKWNYKIMINLNPKKLNNIPIDKLSSEIIMYALNKGFNYTMEVDNRYMEYPEYILYNLNNYPDYKYALLDKTYHIDGDENIKKYYVDEMQKDIKLFLEILKSKPYFIKNFKSFENLNSDEKNQVVEILKEKNFSYTEFPKELKVDNFELGMFFINKDFTLLNEFLVYNKTVSDINAFITLYNQNYFEGEPNFNFIVNLLKNNRCENIDLIKELLIKVVNDIDRVSKILYLYPELINSLELDSRIINTVYVLFMEDKYKLNENTPDYVLQGLFRFADFYILLLKKDFNNIYLIDRCVANNMCKFDFNDSNIYNICKQNNYLLTKGSPTFLKKNIKLLIDSLNNGTIKLDDIDLINYIDRPIEELIELASIIIKQNYQSDYLKYYIDRPVEELIQIVDTAIKYNYENEVIDQMKEKINNSIYKKQKDEYYKYISTDVTKLQFYVNCLPEGVDNIYITNAQDDTNLQIKKGSSNYIQKFDVNVINKMIDTIKQSGRDIKLTFKLNYQFLDSEYLSQINDLNYILFTSENNLTTISALDLLKMNNLLDLFVQDIKNSNLSNYEKYLAIYNIVKGFKEYNFYQNDEKKDLQIYDQSRSIYLILENDYIVCVGYANLLECLLNKVGIDAVSYRYIEGKHKLNYVNITDEKYGIEGIIKCDPTNDHCIDILNCGYKHANMQIIDEEVNTPFDRYLLSQDLNYINTLEKDELNDIYEYVIKLDPSLTNLSVENALMIFKNKKINPASYENLLNAAVNLQEYVYGYEMTEEQRNLTRKNIRLNYINNLGQDKDFLDEFQKDIEKYGNLMNIISLSKYLKLNDYEKKCIKSNVDKQIRQFNQNNQGVTLWFLNENLGCTFKDVSEEEKKHLIEYLGTLSLDLMPTKKENWYTVDISKVVLDMPLQDALNMLKQLSFNSLEITMEEENMINTTTRNM